MTYLSVRNFWNYQNADAWKKAKDSKRGHPAWCKLYVHRDAELDDMPAEARLLWYELLGIATRYANAFRNDPEWIANEARMPIRAVAENLPLLVKGAWLSETKSKRRSRKNLEDSLPQKQKAEAEKELSFKQTALQDATPTAHFQNGHQQPLRLTPSDALDIAKLVSHIHDRDDRTAEVVARYAQGLPQVVLEHIGESLRRHPDRGAGWVINALKDEQRIKAAERSPDPSEVSE